MGAGILPNFWSIRALIAPFSVLERCQDWDLNQSLPKTVSAEWAAWLIRSWSKRRFNSHERLAVKLSSAAQFAAVTELEALDISVLGRDISGLFAVIVDQPGDVVSLL